jgi:hypothetical protein
MSFIHSIGSEGERKEILDGWEDEWKEGRMVFIN